MNDRPRSEAPELLSHSGRLRRAVTPWSPSTALLMTLCSGAALGFITVTLAQLIRASAASRGVLVTLMFLDAAALLWFAASLGEWLAPAALRRRLMAVLLRRLRSRRRFDSLSLFDRLSEVLPEGEDAVSNAPAAAAGEVAAGGDGGGLLAGLRRSVARAAFSMAFFGCTAFLVSVFFAAISGALPGQAPNFFGAGQLRDLLTVSMLLLAVYSLAEHSA